MTALSGGAQRRRSSTRRTTLVGEIPPGAGCVCRSGRAWTPSRRHARASQRKLEPLRPRALSGRPGLQQCLNMPMLRYRRLEGVALVGGEPGHPESAQSFNVKADLSRLGERVGDGWRLSWASSRSGQSFDDLGRRSTMASRLMPRLRQRVTRRTRSMSSRENPSPPRPSNPLRASLPGAQGVRL